MGGAEPTSTSPSSTRRLPNIYAELGTTMASMIVTFPTVWAHLIGQLLHYMGHNQIVFGSDSLWYGGPQWQIEAFWRSQIPDNIREKWGYPQLTEGAKRQILGGNSARLYGLPPATPRYRDGGLPSYATDASLQAGGYMDTVLRGPGYPVPVVQAALTPPNDRFAKIKQWMDDIKVGRSNKRHGWMRTARNPCAAKRRAIALERQAVSRSDNRALPSSRARASTGRNSGASRTPTVATITATMMVDRDHRTGSKSRDSIAKLVTSADGWTRAAELTLRPGCPGALFCAVRECAQIVPG